MKRWLVIVLAVWALSACMRNVDSYNSDPYIVSTLGAHGGRKISVAEFESTPGEGGINQCRGYSIITTPGEGGLVRYIQDAFISELELANAYLPDAPIVLKGKVTQISLSTLTGGEWIIKMTLMSNNGRSISAREQLLFKTNIVGQSACQVASDMYFIAVQNLLRQLVSSPNFPRLLEPSHYPKPPPSPTQPSEGQWNPVRPQAAGTPSPATGANARPATTEIVPLEVTAQAQPVSGQDTPAGIAAEPRKEMPPSDCSIEKQIQKKTGP